MYIQYTRYLYFCFTRLLQDQFIEFIDSCPAKSSIPRVCDPYYRFHTPRDKKRTAKQWSSTSPAYAFIQKRLRYIYSYIVYLMDKYLKGLYAIVAYTCTYLTTTASSKIPCNFYADMLTIEFICSCGGYQVTADLRRYPSDSSIGGFTPYFRRYFGYSDSGFEHASPATGGGRMKGGGGGCRARSEFV